MALAYELLKEVLSKIEAKKNLNKDNIIEEIKTELQTQDQDLYEEWKKGGFDVSHVFNIPIYGKLTLLIIAASHGYGNIVKVLLEKGAHVNEKAHLYDMTALHNAANSGHEDIVNALIAAGAHVNEKDWFGMTPLHFAAKNGHANIVNTLIKAGADVNAASQCGETPLDYAKSKNVVKALLEAGGGSFLKASRKGKIAGGVTILLGTAIAVALFTTGTIAAQLIPIVIAVVAVTAAALVVGCATYARSKPSTKVDGAEKPSAVLTTNEQQEAAL